MKTFLQSISRRFHEPRWRHGKLGALLTACFLIVCILLNIGVKALEDEYGWKRDLSFNGYATTGEETQKALDRLQHDVEVYLLYQSGEVDSYVLNLLERYAVLSDRIAVLPTDIARNPGISQEALSEVMCVNKSNVARAVAQLEEQGFVLRKSSERDKRVLQLFPTEKLQAALPQIIADTRAWNAYLTEGIAEEDLLRFHAILDQIVERAMLYAEKGESVMR